MIPMVLQINDGGSNGSFRGCGLEPCELGALLEPPGSIASLRCYSNRRLIGGANSTGKDRQRWGGGSGNRMIHYLYCSAAPKIGTQKVLV